MKLPKPECELGYTVDQLIEMFGPLESLSHRRFTEWMRGQTMALCQGRRYDMCGGVSHGVIVYAYDVERYVDHNHPDHGLWD